MKAQISELWDIGIDILSIVDSDDSITSFNDLRKCENVLVGEKEEGSPYTSIMIDNGLFDVLFRKVSHPSGGGKLHICEIV